MREIKIWKIIIIWFITPVVVSIILTFLLLLLNSYKDINGILVLFISFLLMLLMVLNLGKVNTKIIIKSYEDFKCKYNIKEIISVTITQIFLSIGLSNLSIGKNLCNPNYLYNSYVN